MHTLQLPIVHGGLFCGKACAILAVPPLPTRRQHTLLKKGLHLSTLLWSQGCMCVPSILPVNPVDLLCTVSLYCFNPGCSCRLRASLTPCLSSQATASGCDTCRS